MLPSVFLSIMMAMTEMEKNYDLEINDSLLYVDDEFCAHLI